MKDKKFYIKAIIDILERDEINLSKVMFLYYFAKEVFKIEEAEE